MGSTMDTLNQFSILKCCITGLKTQVNFFSKLLFLMDEGFLFPSGSAAPGPVPKGCIKVYSMRFCLFAQRARLVLKAKGIK